MWYFPGGKIEPGEEAKRTLIRELAEELNLSLKPEGLRELITVEGLNHDGTAPCRLECYTYDGLQSHLAYHPLRANAEITEVEWLPFNRQKEMAPLVRKTIQQANLMDP